MILRVFRAQIRPGHHAEFERKFREVSLPLVLAQPGVVSASIGRPVPSSPKFSFTEAVSFMIACADQAETDRLWEALTANGGSELGCGWLKDRWGVTWQVTPTRLLELVTGPDRDRASRALASIGNMGKINIAEVGRAAGGA